MKRTIIIVLLAAAVGLLPQCPAAQERVEVVSWNAESGDSDPAVVASRIAGFEGIDVWGICEVSASWVTPFELAAEEGESADFLSILGETGGADRLLIIYNNDMLQLVDQDELHEINPGRRVRSPLVAHFRIRATGTEFLFMVNHLYRTNEAARHTQSRQLNDWAEAQTIPVIAVGDYNYDWRVEDGESNHDRGFDLLTEDAVFGWLKPTVLVRTQYSRSYAPSVLDFIFLANADDNLSGESRIIVEDADFPDDGSTPDHRPVLAELTFGVGAEEPPVVVSVKQQILSRISDIEQELGELRTLAGGLPD